MTIIMFDEIGSFSNGVVRRIYYFEEIGHKCSDSVKYIYIVTVFSIRVVTPANHVSLFSLYLLLQGITILLRQF